MSCKTTIVAAEGGFCRSNNLPGTETIAACLKFGGSLAEIVCIYKLTCLLMGEYVHSSLNIFTNTVKLHY